jgi:hypothetical protein
LDKDLYNEIIWTMKYYGSDAEEEREPGSKLHSQAERIVEYVRQQKMAEHLLRSAGLTLICARSIMAK